jgi:tRNA modification GTPase
MDTIVALATPSGRSAIGVIRLSGTRAIAITRALLGEDHFSPASSRAVLKSIRDPFTKEVLDRALITYFKAPGSFTGDDVVELSCHGSPIILRRVIDLILRLDGRLAGPGEFTLRALSNGKLNLSQAEAIRDLINSQTDAAARQAVRQLSGELSKRVQPLKNELVRLIVQLESALEFVEDDLPAVQAERINQDMLELISDVAALAATFAAGHVLRDGVRVTIVGRPNVGKSSLFNRLVEFDRAIVTEVPGTTRDTLSEQMSIKGVPVLLTDTAGLRESVDRIEMMGVERTQQAMAEADLLVVVVDGCAELSREDFEFLNGSSGTRSIIALNKSDLPTFRDRLTADLNGRSRVVRIAAKTGAGLDDLREAMLQPFGTLDTAESGLLITDARHYDLLCRTKEEIETALTLFSKQASEELILLGLYNGLRFLGEITGETTAEDVLAQIFSTFCIGK